MSTVPKRRIQSVQKRVIAAVKIQFLQREVKSKNNVFLYVMLCHILKKQRVKLKRVEWDEIKRFINREIQAKRDHKMIKNRKQSLDIDEQIAI